MNVLGYDPEITVDAAWSLPAQVKKAASVDDVLKNAQLHVACTCRWSRPRATWSTQKNVALLPSPAPCC